jgi:MYXO-CTERM domain-containing protein
VKIEGNYAAGPGGSPPYPDYDIYDVAGNVYLNGILKIVLQDGFEPGFTAVTGVFFDVLLADMLTIGPQFALDTSMATFTSSPYRGWVYEVVQLPDGRWALRLLVTPEPASYLVWAVAGLAALLSARRRRRQASE